MNDRERSMKMGTILLMIFGCVCRLAAADDYHKQMNNLKALDQRCEQARAVKLAPVREQYVRDCLQDRRRSRQDCQEEARWYGESTSGPNRNFIRGMYYDLPECQEAAQAWKAWEDARPVVR
jgi:hypothetical protein